jgi:hypothetical protein
LQSVLLAFAIRDEHGLVARATGSRWFRLSFGRPFGRRGNHGRAARATL